MSHDRCPVAEAVTAARIVPPFSPVARGSTASAPIPCRVPQAAIRFHAGLAGSASRRPPSFLQELHRVFQFMENFPARFRAFTI